MIFNLIINCNTLCFIISVLTTESAKFFAFSYVELPAAAQPFGRIYITNPGTRVAYVHIRTPLIPYGQLSYVSEDIHVWPGDIANITVPFDTFLAGSAKENKGVYNYYINSKRNILNKSRELKNR